MEETLTYVFEKIKSAVKSSGGEALSMSRKISPPETGTGSVNDWQRNSGSAVLAWIDRICPLETRNRWMLAAKTSGGEAVGWIDWICPPETRNRWMLAAKTSGGEAAAWIDWIFPPETRDRWMLAAKTSVVEAVAWLDEVFPPGTRVETIIRWIHVAKPYIIAAVVVWLVIRLFRGGGGGMGKMMKAPGRNFRMPRIAFESNPKGYFSDLRARR